MDKHYFNSLILSVLTATVVSSLIFFLGARFNGFIPYPQNNAGMINGHDMTKMMKEMMGEPSEK